jgi:hypothetical protein
VHLIRGALLLVCLCIPACATKEVLLTRSAQVPPGVNLSGSWRILKDSSAGRQGIDKAIGRAGGNTDIIPMPAESGRPSRSVRSTSSRGGLVQVFIHTGHNLKVTQTADGIFISFDRSVVEEFRFGENRKVSVGEIVAQRASGWDGNRYVVETLDRKGMKLTEQWYLSSDGHILQRLIVLRMPDKSDVTLRQSFRKIDEAP